MTSSGLSNAWATVSEIFASPRLVGTLSLTIAGTALSSLTIRELMGWAGLLAIVATLVILASLSLIARRREIEWHGLLPVSLLVFSGWAALSILWSQYQWATLAGLIYFGEFTLLAIYLALNRDTIQIARAYGDVLRWMLAVSVGLEIFAGVLIDSPIPFLGTAGNLANFGPIQGIFGTRNALGIVALVALVTFATEWRTRSVPRPLATGSFLLAALCLLFARSPLAFGGALVVGLAALALFALRRVPESARWYAQTALLVVLLTFGAFAWGLRTSIISALGASGELATRLSIWTQVRALIPFHELEGWGWIGRWRGGFPFDGIIDTHGGAVFSSLNMFLDIWLQLGLVGLFAFVVLVLLALVRSWLLASRNRSIVYAWPALVLVLLATTGLADSSMLTEFGWMTFVVCTVKASRDLSWRQTFAATSERR